MKMIIDESDKVFSQYIRKRDGRCMCCGSAVRFNDKGLPISHEASHFFGRVNEATRHDPDNVDCLCHGCHQIWGSNDREAYRALKIKQLGEQGFKLLTIQANTYFKKDRQMALIISKQLLSELFNKGMKQVISKGKKVLIFNCKNCYTKFKTDEWNREEDQKEGKITNKLLRVETTCPTCKKQVFTSL